MPQSETPELPASTMSRRELQAETRARVLEAAAEIFTTQGFHNSSVAEIAAVAGYSTGALYSNFANKDDLFLAVIDERLGEHLTDLVEAYGSADSPEGGLAAVADVFERRLEERFAWNLTMIEFVLRARYDDHLREELGARHRATRTALAAAVEQVGVDRGEPLPSSAASIASALLGLGSGLLLEHLLDPSSSTANAYRHALFSAVNVEDPS